VSSIEALLERGEQLFRDEQFLLAEKVFRGVLEAERGNGRAWNGLGTILHQLGRSDEAERALLKATLFQADVVQTMTNLALVVHEAGRSRDAIHYVNALRAHDRIRFATIRRRVMAHSPDAAVKVLAIGCSPSSGSTLLADLLDSSPGVACGPELYVFCYPSAYTVAFPFEQHVESILRSPGCYQMNRPFFSPRVDEVGMTPAERKSMIEEGGSLRPFVEDLQSRYGRFREKKLELFAEKTPMNVNCLPSFCNRFAEDGFFVHLVRDGRTVVSSLMRRGWTLYEAAYTWMAQVYHGSRARQFENAQEIRYEDLLERRFEMVSDLVSHLGHPVSPEDVQSGFENNTYRAGLARVAAWSVSKFSSEIHQTDSFRDRLSPIQIALLERLETIPAQGAGMVDDVIGFREILVDYEYSAADETADEDELRTLFIAEEKAFLERTDPRLVQKGQFLRLRSN
jgi:tetratricopeptide (TPR) repeat protein